MSATHLTLLRTRVRQLGPWRAARLAALKVMRRVLLDGAQLHFGNHAEDILVLSLAREVLGRRAFTYVDVGCHEPRRISNSYLAYAEGCSGLVIDLNPAFARAFRRERPRDVFVCAAVSDCEREVTVQEFTAAEVATIDSRQAELWAKAFTPTSTRRVKTATLSALVRQHLPGRTIDVLMIDVEGHELEVLRGAELATLRPALIACEIHARSVAQAQQHPVTSLLENSGYRLAAFATVSAYFVRADLAERVA